MPTELMLALGFPARTSRIDRVVASHHASGSCSAQPGRGIDSVSGVVAAASTSPEGATRIALTPLVPMSSPRNTDSLTLPHSEQQFHRQLIEPFVCVAARAQAVEVERLILELARQVGGVAYAFAGGRAARTEISEERLDFPIGVEARDLLSQNEVGAHAAAREVPHAGFVLGAIGVAVEVSHAIPLR